MQQFPASDGEIYQKNVIDLTQAPFTVKMSAIPY